MHILLLVIILVLSIKKGNWKDWELYYPTMLYISLSSTLYEFISHSQFHLWELQEKGFLSHMNVHYIHSLIINPLVAFIFLSNYPEGWSKKLTYTLKWIIAFLIAEWFGTKFHLLHYHNGWNLGWSSLFLVIMFPMLRLHYLHKILAICFSVCIVFFLLLIFNYI